MERLEINIFVDAKGLLCPQPLVEARKRLRKMPSGEILEIIGDHAISKKEIPKAMRESGDEILSVEDQVDGSWRIVIRKAGE